MSDDEPILDAEADAEEERITRTPPVADDLTYAAILAASALLLIALARIS